ncbi:MAG: 50S ribosomal protein L15 [bacterium]|nr:50S ribosomal protein L15 [bacterium]
MKLNELRPSKGSKKAKKRVGRGTGSGKGKTSGRGHKGQLARSGGKSRRGFEGGQMPLARRVPKRGFTSLKKKLYAVVNVEDLNQFEPETLITPDVLQASGLIKQTQNGVKILGKGDLKVPLMVEIDWMSEGAKEKILSAGGSVAG